MKTRVGNARGWENVEKSKDGSTVVSWREDHIEQILLAAPGHSAVFIGRDRKLYALPILAWATTRSDYWKRYTPADDDGVVEEWWDMCTQGIEPLVLSRVRAELGGANGMVQAHEIARAFMGVQAPGQDLRDFAGIAQAYLQDIGTELDEEKMQLHFGLEDSD